MLRAAGCLLQAIARRYYLVFTVAFQAADATASHSAAAPKLMTTGD